MVERRQSVGVMARPFWPGLLVGVAGGAFVLLAIAFLFTSGGAIPFDRLMSAYSVSILRFTLTQTALSVALSVAGGLAVAIALIRRPRFTGRTLLLRLFALPLALPPLVAALGLLAVWGRGGLVGELSAIFGSSWRPDVFGLQGVVLAHVFFNLPLAARLILAQLDRQPPETFRLADQLNLNGWSRFALVEWPLIRPHLPAVSGLITMLCVGSFTLVLILGGGPNAATFEVAIYQALRFDFSPGLAALYALAQLALTAMLLVLLGLAGGVPEDRVGARGGSDPRAGASPSGRWTWGVLVAAAILVCLPLVALLLRGLAVDWPQLMARPRLWTATLTSLVIATSAACLSVAAAYSLVRMRYAAGTARLAESPITESLYRFSGSAVLAVPPIVLGAGWFLALRGLPFQTVLAGALIVLVNALMALPFVLRVLEPAYGAMHRRYDNVANQLGMAGWTRLRLVDLPGLAPAFATAFLFALVLSVGDLGAAALFGAYDIVTLPLLVLQLLGSYRTADAAGVALVLGVFALGLMALSERFGSAVR